MGVTDGEKVMIEVTGEVRAALARIRHLYYEKGCFGRALQMDCLLLDNFKPKNQAFLKPSKEEMQKQEFAERSHEEAKDYLTARSHVTNEDMAILSTKHILQGLSGYEQAIFSIIRDEIPKYLET
jgi:hypothetical protein